MCRRPYVIFQVCMLSLSALIVPICIYQCQNHHKASETISLSGSLQLFGASDECVYEGHVSVRILRWLTMRSASWSRADEMDKNKLAHGDVSDMTSHDIDFQELHLDMKGVDVPNRLQS